MLKFSQMYLQTANIAKKHKTPIQINVRHCCFMLYHVEWLWNTFELYLCFLSQFR